MLSEQQVSDFKENGFVFGGHVLSASELNDLQVALKRTMDGESSVKPELIRNIGRDDTQVVTQIVNIWQAEPAFQKHLYNEKILAMVSQLIGTDTLRVWHDQIQVKPARLGGPTIWHQDFPYWPVIAPGDLVSAWVALEDATVENGCMWMARHSHKWGVHKGGTVGQKADELSPDYDPSLIPEGETVEIVPCPVPAGSVLFHHCMTWHGAPPNRSENERPAIAVHYMPGYTRYEPKGPGHLVEAHVEVGVGEVLKGSHFPTVMEDGVVLKP